MSDTPEESVAGSKEWSSPEVRSVAIPRDSVMLSHYFYRAVLTFYRTVAWARS